MLFPQLQTYKNQNPDFAPLFSNLEPYLQEVLQRDVPNDPWLTNEVSIISELRKDQVHAINPEFVATKLRVRESVAVGLLGICNDAGIVTPRYDIYCPETNDLIKTFYSKDDLPQEISCPYHNSDFQHSIEDYLIEFLFVFSEKVLRNRVLLARKPNSR